MLTDLPAMKSILVNVPELISTSCSMSSDSQQEIPWSSPMKHSFTRCFLFIVVLLSAASAADAGEYVYFADDEPPADSAPPEAPLCYKFKADNLEEQLDKLRKKYADKIYDAKIVKNADGSHSLTAKRRGERNKIIFYFYSDSPSQCNKYQKMHYVQMDFGLEENNKIKVPADIPQSIMEELLQDCAPEEESNVESSYFLASVVDLNDDGRKDFVIQPVGSMNGCPLGAHSTIFWIFVHTSKGYKLVFKKTGQWMNVSEIETNGYKNISISDSTGAVTIVGVDYRYDGKKYTSYRCFSYSIDQSFDDHSAKYEKCSFRSIE